MWYIGVDLAWGPNGMTGLAAVDEHGQLVEATQARTDAEIVAWLEPVTAGPCVAAIDAPIVVRNATSSRLCERLVGRYFGSYGAFCYPSNTANPAFATGTRALQLAAGLGLDIDPGSAAQRRAIEVYPHPAIVALFGLPSILRYKAKPGRDLESLRAELLRLLALIESLETGKVPLRVRNCAAWRQIRRSVETAATKATLGRVEDSIDAVMCAHIARLANVCPDQVRVLGTVSDGYILTPVTPRIAARIDADHHGSPGNVPATQATPVKTDRPEGEPFPVAPDADPSQLTKAERIALLDAILQRLAPTADGIRVHAGGEEASLLWEATVDSFANGIWVATILCAQATCERVLADLVSLRELPGYGLEGPKGWQSWGMGKLIAHVREQRWIETDLLDAVTELCEARKPYGHFRRPFDTGTIGRQIADALVNEGWDAYPRTIQERILSADAFRSARTTLYLYFGDYARGPFQE